MDATPKLDPAKNASSLARSDLPPPIPTLTTPTTHTEQVGPASMTSAEQRTADDVITRKLDQQDPARTSRQRATRARQDVEEVFDEVRHHVRVEDVNG